MNLALKIDVDTLRGTREGVPALLALLRRHDLRATFLWSLGPDHTGRAIRRVFRRGFVGKLQRTSVLRHYGLRTLLYGTVLPGPDIGHRSADVLRSARDDGHEMGIHCWDHAGWQDGVASADPTWINIQMQRACDRFTQIFRTPPRTHGAAGWQMSAHALRLTQRLGFDYCSDGRGTGAHWPVWNAELIRCPQLPTTLPTLDELLGREGITEANVADRVLALTATRMPAPQVFTLHAELEGMRLLAVFDALIEGWKAQGWDLGGTGALLDTLPAHALPRCEVLAGSIPGRSGTVLLQGPEFLGDVELPQAA